MKRPKANSNFFKTWSSSMAYILGFIVTDGCLVEYRNGYHGLNITNKDKNILVNILKAMNSGHKISIKTRGHGSDRKYFQVTIRDRIIYIDLLKLGLTPRKSKTIRMPNAPSGFFGDFIRGCFDGDGSVNVWQDPRWKHSWQMRAVFYSGSLDFLKDIQKRMYNENGLSNGSIQCRPEGHAALCYSIRDSVMLYRLMYKHIDDSSLFFKRKRDKFEFFKKVRPDCFVEDEAKSVVGLYR